MIAMFLARAASIVGACVVVAAVCSPAVAKERLPVMLVSSSPAFDRACTTYYRQGNDADVQASVAKQFCTCLGAEYEHLGRDALAFFARTYSEDLTAFIDEYDQGEYWMGFTAAAEKVCKEADYGDNQSPQESGANGGIEAASWGGIVRSGPGKEFSKVGTLEEGERVMLLQNTGKMFDGYPWWKIEIWGGNATGYQWGGILCSLNAPMEGIYETCD